MIIAGVDVGAQTIKVVLLDNERVLTRVIIKAVEGSTFGAERAMQQALEEVGLSMDDIEYTVSTGIGGGDVLYSHKNIADISCIALGAIQLVPGARTVLSMGAEEFRALRCNEKGEVNDFIMNDKCAAGSGAFIEAMAVALETSLEEMGSLSLQAEQDIHITSTCTILAESEVVSYVHLRQNKADIAKGIHDSITSRIVAMTGRIGIEEDVVFVGGVAQNIGMVKALRSKTGVNVIIPDYPQFVGALGAAIAANREAMSNNDNEAKAV